MASLFYDLDEIICRPFFIICPLSEIAAPIMPAFGTANSPLPGAFRTIDPPLLSKA
jgi:hypothetical protein